MIESIYLIGVEQIQAAARQMRDASDVISGSIDSILSALWCSK